MSPLYFEVAPGYEGNCQVLDRGVNPVIVINDGDSRQGVVMVGGEVVADWEGGVKTDGTHAFVNFSEGVDKITQIELGEQERLWETWVMIFPWLTLKLELPARVDEDALS